MGLSEMEIYNVYNGKSYLNGMIWGGTPISAVGRQVERIKNKRKVEKEYNQHA